MISQNVPFVDSLPLQRKKRNQLLNLTLYGFMYLKKYLVAALMAALLMNTACNKNDDDTNPTDPSTSLVTLQGNLSTQTLDASKKYLLRGQVFVPAGQTVTIPAGTVIFGEKRSRATLIVDRGGKLEVLGTKDRPVVMTSAQAVGERDRGDWGGLVILGNARTNQPDPVIEGIEPPVVFGGNNDDDNSGTYKYLRVEYAGIELTPNNETNSITMGGVGRGTVMEHCMVSFGGDDGFEWFGGSINGKYLVSHSTWDDDFDCDYGWSGNVQFGLVVRNPFFADQSQSNAFECDNGPNDNDVQPYTTGTFSNVTVLGPRDNTGRAISGNNAHTIDLRRRTSVSIFNTVAGGFPTGVRFNTASVQGNYEAGRGVLANNILIVPNTAFAAGGGADRDFVASYWTANNSVIDGTIGDDTYRTLGINPALFFAKYTLATYPSNPNFAVTSGSLTSGAKYDNPKFNEPNRAGFFENVPFMGAFGAEDWTDGWAEFNPLEKAY
jgi:hypothetical protein